MAEYTLTYDEKVRGWTSFHSYIPEYMTALNNDYFSFKNGQLYQHNKTTGNRNTFYGTSHNTEVEVSSNAAPSEVKIFKTIEIEGNSSGWDVTIITDLDAGHIDKSSFAKTEFNTADSSNIPNTYNEGSFSTHIRRNSTDEVNTELLSVQGIGNLISLSGTTYSFGVVPTSVSIGDVLYQAVGGSYNRVGQIVYKDGTNITLGTASVIPNVQDFMFAAKSPIAESYGLKGYYASIKLVSSETSAVELYAVNSEVSKSFS